MTFLRACIPYPTPGQSWSDQHFPVTLIRLGKLGLTLPSSPGAQLRPPTSLYQSPITAQRASLCGKHGTLSLPMESHATSTAQNVKTRQNGKALKQRPSANFHLLCHLASFSSGHTESVFVGLDFHGRSGWPAGGRCLGGRVGQMAGRLS